MKAKKLPVPAKTKKTEVKKPKTDRLKVHAANIDFTTFKVYIRLKMAKPKFAELYQTAISPKGNIYAESEDLLLRNIRKVFAKHIEQAEAVYKLLGKKDIPVEYINDDKQGAILSLNQTA